jgi:hypothetical protein
MDDHAALLAHCEQLIHNSQEASAAVCRTIEESRARMTEARKAIERSRAARARTESARQFARVLRPQRP